MPLIDFVLIGVAIAALAVSVRPFIGSQKARRQARSQSDDDAFWIGEVGPNHTSYRPPDPHSAQDVGSHEHPGVDGHDLGGHDGLDVGDHDVDHFDLDHF